MVAATLTLLIGGYSIYRKHKDKTTVLVDVLDPLTLGLWMSANCLWMVSDIYGVGADVYPEGGGAAGDDFVTRLGSVLFFLCALVICQGAHFTVFFLRRVRRTEQGQGKGMEREP